MKQSLLLLIPICCLCCLNGCGGSSSSVLSPTGDFNITASPASVSTQVGATTSSVAVSLSALNGFTGPVTVNVSGFPDGINSSPASPFMLSSGTPQQVTFFAPAAAGTFTVQFQGVSGTLSHSASAILTVTPQPSPYLVSASYYPWYQATNWPNQYLRGDLIPPELPVLGLYLSQDQDVMTQQIAWSAAAGINVWDLEWIVPNDFEDQTIQNTIMTNPHIGDIRFGSVLI